MCLSLVQGCGVVVGAQMKDGMGVEERWYQSKKRWSPAWWVACG